MPLHRKHDRLKRGSEGVIAPGGGSPTVPKFKIPRDELSARTAYSLIHDELLLDGNARQNLATFCTTTVDPEMQKRNHQPLPDHLPPPPKDWTVPYRKLAREVGVEADLDAGYREARAFRGSISLAKSMDAESQRWVGGYEMRMCVSQKQK
jgi:hypothetical protein